jgi:hypothetical protein
MGKQVKAGKQPKDRKVTAVKTAIFFTISLIAYVLSWVLWPEDDDSSLFLVLNFAALMGLIAFSTRLIVVLVQIWAEGVAEKTRKAEAEEEARLLKIKETMTPAEWETYKLQLENNKLLRDLKKSSSKKGSTTSYGFTQEL